MNTSYEAWARYDVDEELERVDVQERQEHESKLKQLKVAEKRHVEESISRDAEQSAEVLAAHAAVAALRANGRHRSKKTGRDNAGAASGEGRVEAERVPEADALRKVAELVKRKHDLIKETMDARRRGDDLAQKADWGSAIEAYGQGLASAEALLLIAPEVAALSVLHKESSEGNQREDSCEMTASIHSCHIHNHEKQNCECPSKPHVKVLPAEKLPEKDDLKAIAKMFLKDCFLGIGTTQMGRQHYAAASEAFKEVLLRDQNNLLAWLQRGKAFEQMESPLLAWLHYSRVTSLDSRFEDAQECEDHIKHVLLNQDGTDPHAKRTYSPASSLSAKDLLLEIKLSLDAANVVMVEGFFEYAVQKYETTLQLVASAQTLAQITAGRQSLLRQLEIACHLNIASCFLEMKKHFGKALRHCELVLEVDPVHKMANFRLGQVHRAMHAYDSSLKAYEDVRNLLLSLPTTERDSQLKKLEDEIDKCQFDRTQHDLVYIREQIQRERSN